MGNSMVRQYRKLVHSQFYHKTCRSIYIYQQILWHSFQNRNKDVLSTVCDFEMIIMHINGNNLCLHENSVEFEGLLPYVNHRAIDNGYLFQWNDVRTLNRDCVNQSICLESIKRSKKYHEHFLNVKKIVWNCLHFS